MTDPARWARLERLFDEALDRPPDDVDRWLEDRCGDDTDLADRLRRMLAAHERGGVLDRGLPSLAADDLRKRLARALEGRYEIGDLLGSGGMSSVFLAREVKHDRPVVLKVLQPGLAAAIGPQRFEDEVRIAARLSHPHILALIDSGEVDHLRYYVMPYVGGTTLRHRLEAAEEFPLASTIMFLRDIADALVHAHEAGVVHRDLKPENVLCVRGHAFLLDFGVAKLEVGSASTLTGPGLAVGTPGYMAPEQAAGRPIDHRADIYAWGLLAREMLTRSRDPAARLDERTDLPATLAALVEASLALDPDERPNTARSLAAALDGMVAPVRDRGSRVPMVVAVLAAVAIGWWLLTGRHADPVTVGTLAQPIAVAPLRDETGDPALSGLGRLAGDWITQGLHESGTARIVAWPASRAAVEGSAGADDDASRLRAATGAGTAVVGSYYLLGDSLALQVEVVDTRRHLVLLAPAPIIVHRDSGTAAVRVLRQRVMGALAVQQDDRLAQGPAFAVTPPTYEAYRSFDRGLVAFDDYRYDEALADMTAAWHLDTTFTSALVYAAYAAWNDGERPTADSLLREVQVRRQSLSTYQLGVTGFIAGRLAGDFRVALEGAIQAWDAAPGSRAGYNAAQSLLALNRPVEALVRLDSLDPDTGPMRGWSAYWSQRAYAAHLLGEHGREYADAEEMGRRHPDKRVSGVIKARALAAMGNTASLDSLLKAQAGLPPDTYWSQGAMRVVAGEELAAHHDRAQAEPYLLDAVAWLEARLRVVPDEAGHQYWLASALVALQRWAEAEAVVERLLRADPSRTLYRGMAASLAARRGDARHAKVLLDSIPAWSQGEGLVFRARVAAVEGRTDDAIVLLDQAMQLGFDGWHWVHGSALHDLASLHDDPRFERITANRTS